MGGSDNEIPGAQNSGVVSSSSPQEKKSNVFNHHFSGYSIWIEPCTHDAKHILEEMKGLETLLCNGEKNKNEVHYSFMPHCTVLYNFDPSELEKLSDETMMVGNIENDVNRDQRVEDVGRKMLLECLDIYRSKEASTSSNRSSSSSSTTTTTSSIELIPTDFYFFPYPKEADGGKGFGCVIPLLMLECTTQLETLHSAVKQVFPKDERHANEGSRFIPHMALSYAPESYEDELRRYTEDVLKVDEKKQILLNKMKGSYLSLWSTEGQLKDWRPIVKVSI
eukprot:CAMPEP_0204628036 /NCGR_PEP_ID=MMETSP0717-20131115/14805_1 /ASSEMBLY_ACC=CAM_ASM_000666 /TAXON_ID=230516 /ORGANISM="Chaetoceros curvisetus" /LENGTH=278 /DNA_ID=CAMNT_0051644479 /DNA_START=22 /DNA_END=858 /DNA_ORIENTATION=-